MKLVLEEDKIKEEEPEKIIPFKELSFKQKLIQIWDYYKWKIIIPIVCAVCVVSLSLAIYENCKDSLLYAVFINTQLTDEESTALMDEFVDYADLDMKGKKITLDGSLYINQKNAGTGSVYSNQKLLAMFTSIEMDVIVCDEANFKYYASNDCFVDLSEVLTEDFLNEHQDLLMSTRGKDGKNHTYGISLASSKKLEEYGAFLEEPILTIPVTHMEDENIRQFVSFLLEE